jgi:hypothetical protein
MPTITINRVVKQTIRLIYRLLGGKHMSVLPEVLKANEAYAASFGAKSQLALPPARRFASAGARPYSDLRLLL